MPKPVLSLLVCLMPNPVFIPIFTLPFLLCIMSVHAELKETVDY